jgi:hypothetical protein
MTERPILFKGEMVRAILDGRKTQTRRVMKVQPYPDSIVTVEHYHPTVIDRHGDMQPGPEIFGAHWDDGEYGCRSPYGAPGDMLWVREAWRAWSQYDDWPPSRLPPGVDVQYIADASAPWSSRYRSPRYMPRWASRITLRITDIRVERLQDISEDNARTEGCEARPFPGPWWQGYRDLGDGQLFHQQAVGETPPEWMIEPKKMPATPWLDRSARDGFRSIWMGLYGPDAWDENPWVWVIEFERVKP